VHEFVKTSLRVRHNKKRLKITGVGNITESTLIRNQARNRRGATGQLPPKTSKTCLVVSPQKISAGCGPTRNLGQLTTQQKALSELF